MNEIYDHMTKLKNAWNDILKVLTCGGTHPGELFAPKIGFSCFFEDKRLIMEFRTI